MDLSRIDFAALGKGSVVRTRTLEEATGVSRHHRAFTKESLKVKDALADWFRRERGEVVTVVHRGDTLAVLTDPEAAEYNRRAGELAARKLRAAFRRNRAVDVAALGSDSRRDHERTLEVQSKQVQAVALVASGVELIPVRRNVPKIA